MTKQHAAHNLSNNNAIPKRFNIGKLKISALSLATAMSMLGLSQVACAELTWGDNESYQQDTNYQPQTSYSQDSSVSSFNAAAQAENRGDVSALYNYEQMMSGGLFAMYPTYWRMNLDLNSQSSAAVSQFVRQYPNTVMAEKLAADFAETKAASGDYASVRQVANLITNADASERCAIGLGFNNGGDTMRAMAAKSDVWLKTLKQPALCEQLAT
jgi:soluble lytic murein transglycosylase